jgi:hypothetical protein
MPVVINQFEVLPDTAPDHAAQQSQDESGGNKQEVDPKMLASALARHAERAARVWAH